MASRLVRTYYKWQNFSPADDFLQLVAPTGDVISWITGAGVAGGALAGSSGGGFGSASFTTTGTSTTVVPIVGATSSSQVSITPTNAAAAIDMGAGNVYVSIKSLGSVTIAHSSTSGESFDVWVTI